MRTSWIAALVALLLVLAGCSASSGGPDTADVAAPGPESGAEAAGDDAAGDDAAGEDGAADGSAAVAEAGSTAEGPMMVRRAEVSVLVEDVAAAATRARATVMGAGGWVASEEVVPRTESRSGHASLVLRVPSADLDATVESLGELGEVTSSRSSAEDVTAEYRDVEARVATLEAGAERLRELIAEAPSVESIASLERELSQREADLDALKARMKVLQEDVSRSTITLHLAEEGADLATVGSGAGFVSGLQQGWAAFTTSVSVLLTALGALLPFLVVLALVGLPFLWWRRRRRTTIGSRGDRQAAAAGDPDGS